MKQYLLFLLVLISSSANAQQDILIKNKSLIEKELKTWITTFKNFNLTDFKFIDSFTSTLIKDTNDLFVADASNKDATALLYIYNKSKNYAIDLYGGQATLQYKKGKYSFEDADDGGPLYLHNLKEKKTYKIEYNSFSYFAEEALWLTDSKFILAYIFNDNGIRKPSIYCGNLKENKLYFFQNKKENCNRKMGSYTSKKLLQLNNRKKK
jgi:hypothetical protein